MKRILVSGCLMGQPVRHDGRARGVWSESLERWRLQKRLVTICPEVAGGFPTPRVPAEIEPDATGADVLAGCARVRVKAGGDVTRGFLAGAKAAVRLARSEGCHFALLADGSPSCGTTFIHSGRFDGETRTGQGVVAAALREAGVAVFAEDRIDKLAEAMGESKWTRPTGISSARRRKVPSPPPGPDAAAGPASRREIL